MFTNLDFEFGAPFLDNFFSEMSQKIIEKMLSSAIIEKMLSSFEGAFPV